MGTNKTFLVALITGLAFMAGCQKDTETAPEGFIIQVGDFTNSAYVLNLPRPDTVFHNTFHETLRKLDLDGDGEIELFLVSCEMLINPTTVARELKLVNNPVIDGGVSILVENPNPPYLVKPFTVGSTVDVDDEFVYNDFEEVALAHYSVNLQNGTEEFIGNWNGRSDKCFLIKFMKHGNIMTSWVKISVTEYDNYVFHSYATFSKD
jgi:hypothetical protein